jgi:hypothetical protein
LKKILQVVAVLLVLVGTINFLWFLLECRSLGGDALNGFERDGHFFVVRGTQSREVESGAWHWNRLHAVSLFVTHPLGIISILYLIFAVAGSRFVVPQMGVDEPSISSSKDDRIARIGGVRIGKSYLLSLNFSAPFGAIAVTRDGTLRIEIKFPLFRRSYFLKRENVITVRPYKGIFSTGLKIEHRIQELPPYIVFWTSQWRELQEHLRILGYEVAK